MFNETPDYTAAVQLVIEAREHLEAAVEALQMLGREVPDVRARVDAYLISTLEQAISDDNEWLGGYNSCNLAELEDELLAAEDQAEIDELAARTEADEIK